MMNRYTSILTMACLAFSAQAQTELTPAEYQSLKAHEMLPDGQIIILSGDAPTGGPSEWVLNRGGGDCDCWIAPDNDYTLAMLPNDDMSSMLITLPFTFSLFGQQYVEVYINNNGNISFENSYGTFTASGFPSADFIMVAPFWADVDTRGDDGNGLNGGEVLYKVTDHALYVNWVEVGYFSSQTDKHNTFQLIITDGTDPVVPGGNNVSFCYQDMQWTTGSASMGTGGFGGTSATVGANRGNNADHAQVGRFNADNDVYNGAYTDSSGVHWLDSTHFYLNTAGNGVPPIFGSTFTCDTVVVQMPMDDAEDREGEFYHLIVLPGAPDELVSCTSTAPTLPNFVNINEGFSEKLLLEFQINSDEAEVGFHYITFTAQNNDPEPLTSTYVLQVEKTGSTLGVADAGAETMMNIAPNPAMDAALLSWPAARQVGLIEVISADGRRVMSERRVNIGRNMLLDLKSVAPGTYMVRASTSDGLLTTRLVKTAY